MNSKPLQLIEAASPDTRARFCAASGLSAIAPQTLDRQRPDAMLMLNSASSEVVARCSVWWRQSPLHEGARTGLIGHYAARDEIAATQLLEHASQRLSMQGCSWAIGPMDGNTWQSYRLVVESGTEPAFFLEPAHPPDWPMHFLANQFTVLAYYYSALNTNLDRPDPGLEDVARDVESHGIRIRPIDLQTLPAELDRLYDLSLICFREGFLFTPLPREDFVAQYRELAAFARPELVLLAEQGDRIVGYLFALPDWLEARRGAAIVTFIIKTLAVHPDYHGAGVGRLLAARCHEIARGLGYRRAIHALMIETSGARKLSDPIAQPMRRYALFARKLRRAK